MAFKRHHFQLDTPTNNFATWNPLENAQRNAVLSNGNLKTTDSTSNWSVRFLNLVPVKGMYYVEFYIQESATTTGVGIIAGNGMRTWPENYGTSGYPYDSNTFGVFQNGSIYSNNGTVPYSATFSDGDVVSMIIDYTTRNFWVRVNNNVVSGDNHVAGSQSGGVASAKGYSELPPGDMYVYCCQRGQHNNSAQSRMYLNAGQDHTFLGNKSGGGDYQDANGLGSFYYQPPAGALALCTENLPLPAITPHYDEEPGDYFKAVTYVGDGTTTKEVTVGFSPDFCWFKDRVNGNSHTLIDSVRGGVRLISSHLNVDGVAPAEYSSPDGTDGVLDFNSGSTNNKIKIGCYPGWEFINSSGASYIAWCWKAGGFAGKYNVDGKAYATAVEAGLNVGSITINKASINTKSGFGIYQYTGSGSTSGKLAHGLNQAPSFMIVKRIDGTAPPIGLYTDSSQSYDMYMAGSRSNTVMFQAEVDSATIGFNKNGHGGHPYVNSGEYILYAWHSVPGYSAIGTYTGNQNTNGPFVYTGFKPAFVMVKPVSSNHWSILDSSRDEHNPAKLRLLPSNENTESQVGPKDTFEFLSNGFKVVTSDNLENYSGTVIYMAFAEKPPAPQTTAKVIADPSRRPNDMHSIYFDKLASSDSNSNVLYTTLGTATNDKVFTCSLWVKPLNGGHYGGDGQLLCMRNKTGNGGTGKGFPFRGGDTTLNLWLGSGKVFKGEIKTGDENKWYHLVFQSHNNNGQRGNVYIDGQLDPSLTEIDITEWNLASGQYITIGGYDAGIHGFHGYMANVHLIDGQALEPSAFTETVDGVLIPKQYEGTYGNIGFYLDFAPENMEYSGDTITRVLDESPNSNHWDVK